MWRTLAGVLQIVSLSIAAAIFYGVLHDQVTARVCLEYFTVGHPILIDTRSPTLLGLLWGVIATWWVGLLLGLPLGIFAQVGPLPKVAARELLRPLQILLGCMALLALLSGVTGYIVARQGGVWLPPEVAARIPPAHHDRFLADLWAHNASYLSGFLGGNVLFGWTWRQRRLRQQKNQPGTMKGHGQLREP